MTSQLPATDYEHQMRVWEIRKAAHVQLFSAHIGAMAKFSGMVMNSIILANTAAAGAVLAFLAALWGESAMKIAAGPALDSLYNFAIGVVSGMTCAGASYLSQFCYARGDLADNAGGSNKSWYRAAYPFHFIAIAAAILGIAMFIMGTTQGLAALKGAVG